ncbi:MAG: arginine repressor, partial [Clostridia bacterium]|nr:arginine repressor [Clostridia bacterium]
SGIVCYRADSQTETSDVEQRLRSILKHRMVSLDSAENDVVIKTLPGVAQAAAAAIDAMHWNEIVGSIAGDDTILMVTRSAKTAIDVIEKLKRI